MFRCFSRNVSKSTKEALRAGQTVKQRLQDLEKDHVKSLPEWTKRDRALKVKHGNWNPTRKLDRQQIQELRNITRMLPHLKTVQLSEMFRVSPEAIRRILKSNWVPTDQDEDKLLARAEKKRKEKQQRWREQKDQEQREQRAHRGDGGDRVGARAGERAGERTSYRKQSSKAGGSSPDAKPNTNFASKSRAKPRTRIGSTRRTGDMSELIE